MTPEGENILLDENLIKNTQAEFSFTAEEIKHEMKNILTETELQENDFLKSNDRWPTKLKLWLENASLLTQLIASAADPSSLRSLKLRKIALYCLIARHYETR